MEHKDPLTARGGGTGRVDWESHCEEERGQGGVEGDVRGVGGRYMSITSRRSRTVRSITATVTAVSQA